MKSYFVGGKLKLKNSKANQTTIKIKKTIADITHSQINSGSTLNENEKHKLIKEKEILQEFQENFKDYMQSKNGKIDLNEFIGEKENKKQDYKTEAEKKFDEFQKNKQTERIEKEVQGNKKQLQEKFKKILDKQVNHFDIPKVGG